MGTFLSTICLMVEFDISCITYGLSDTKNDKNLLGGRSQREYPLLE